MSWEASQPPPLLPGAGCFTPGGERRGQSCRVLVLLHLAAGSGGACVISEHPGPCSGSVPCTALMARALRQPSPGPFCCPTWSAGALLWSDGKGKGEGMARALEIRPPMHRYPLGKGTSTQLHHYVILLALLVVGICALPMIEQPQPNRRAISWRSRSGDLLPRPSHSCVELFIPDVRNCQSRCQLRLSAVGCFALFSTLQRGRKS